MSKRTSTAPQKDGDQAVLQCAGLTKVFRDFWMRHRVSAVEGVSLSAQKGEVLGLLGPNGSGKSTTIKLILGLLHPTAGRVLVFGKDPQAAAVKRRVGYLPEESYLYPFLNARETLDYYGRLFGLTRNQRSSRTEMLLEMVGLQAVQRRPVGEYSKGMQRRIGLAQALINDPDLLILDEPTTGMDPIGSRQIKDLIVELSRRGKTVVLCSHLLADVEDVCHRVAIMFGGRIHTIGKVDDLLVQQGVTTLRTPLLSQQTIEQIEGVLAAHGKHIEKVDHPRQKLESLFLEIVNKAHEQGLQTSGARRGGRIAEFLRAGGGGPHAGVPLPDRARPAHADRAPAAADTASAPAEPEEQAIPLDGEDAVMIDSLSGDWQTKSEDTIVGMPLDLSDLNVETGGGGPGAGEAGGGGRSLLDDLAEVKPAEQEPAEKDQRRRPDTPSTPSTPGAGASGRPEVPGVVDADLVSGAPFDSPAPATGSKHENPPAPATGCCAGRRRRTPGRVVPGRAGRRRAVRGLRRGRRGKRATGSHPLAESSTGAINASGTMFKRFTPQVLSVGLLACAVAAMVAAALLGEIELTPRWAIRASVLLGGLALWMGYGWWKDQERHWAWLGVGAGALAVGAVFWSLNWYGGAVTVIAAVAMGSCFVALLEVMCLGLGPPLGVFGVARVLIHEVVRTRGGGIVLRVAVLLGGVAPARAGPGRPLALPAADLPDVLAVGGRRCC